MMTLTQAIDRLVGDHTVDGYADEDEPTRGSGKICVYGPTHDVEDPDEDCPICILRTRTREIEMTEPRTLETRFGTWTIRDDRADFCSKVKYGPPDDEDYSRAVILYGPGYSSITTRGTIEIPPEIARLIAEKMS